jgi:hypothetical protein
MSLVTQLRRLTGGRPRPARPRRLSGELESALGRSGAAALTDWWTRRQPTLYPRPDAAVLPRLRGALGDDVVAALGRNLLEHRFDLLGSGLVQVADASRPQRPDGYRPLDWQLDARSGHRFSAIVAPGEWKPAEIPPGAEVKWPWELGRCQHWPVLAQLWLLTGDRRFAREIVAQFEDFAEGVGVGRGVQWICAMDVGLRAANWALAFEWIRDAVDAPEAFWPGALGMLYDHGSFVAEHLENGYEVTSNHYLSDLVGLLFVGCLFSGLEQGREWEAFARRELEKEIRVQVLPDGADYESSVPYHRLVAELLLGAARLFDLSGKPASQGFRDRLAAMLEYQEAVLRPDGSLPVVGDADDGRLHVLDGYGAPPTDGRHLFGPAAFVLGRPRWLATAGATGRREACWWGFAQALDEPDAAASLPSVGRLFEDAGVAVYRQGGDYLLVTNGRVGTAGFGNHKHNDQLSFELHVAGQALVVDPGSYLYTSDPQSRNAFRGTGFHNTLAVDGREQNELNPGWLFRLQERAHAQHAGFALRNDRFEYRGSHRGFVPLVHERAFRLLREGPVLIVMDRLIGRGAARLRWHFHFAPGVSVSPIDGGLRLEASGQGYRLLGDLPAAPRIGASSCSPSYGVRLACAAAEFEESATLSGELVRFFVIGPEDALGSGERLAAHRRELLAGAGRAG